MGTQRDKILRRISGKIDAAGWKEDLCKLSGTEFNSLLLEIFRERSENIKPVQVLKDFESNRFVQPAKIDTLQSREIELTWLKQADQEGFSAITLSPVSPFGTCSAVGTVSQNKILSSLKGTEVVADATNVMALKIAQELGNNRPKDTVISYSTFHRHVRSQYFDNPDYSAHFSVFCLASGGFDRGSYLFELIQLNHHISLIIKLLSRSFELEDVLIRFYLKSENATLEELLKREGQAWSSIPYEVLSDLENKYYQTIQFKIFIRVNDQFVDFGDGGIVDWTQKMTGNKKQRLMISGVGIELAQKLLKGRK